jgi:SAM-dependent methyltransferase
MVNAARLKSSDLLALWFREEREYATRLRSVSWDSHTRRTLQRQAYECVHALSGAYDRCLGQPISLGFRTFYGRLLSNQCLGILRAESRRATGGRTPSLRFLEIGVGRGDAYPFLCDYLTKHGSLHAGSRRTLLGRVQCWGCDLVIAGAPHDHSHAASCPGSGECGVQVMELREGELLDLADHYEQMHAFDLVFWNDVIEHLPGPIADQYLQAIKRILRPGGRLITCTPSRLTGPHDVSRFVVPPGEQPMGLHLREYSHRELRALLRRAGFRRFRSPIRVSPASRLDGGSVAESVKWIVEPLLGRLPMEIRRRIIDRFCFDAIVCQKPAQ